MRVVGLLLAVMLLGVPVTVLGQEPARATDERTYGTLSEVSHTVTATSFVQFDTTATDHLDSNLRRFCMGATSCLLSTGLLLPAGALITKIQLDSCDDATDGGMTATLVRLPSGLGFVNPASVSTGGPETPGCGLFEKILDVPETVDNTANAYAVKVNMSSSSPLIGTLRFQAVRVFYKLQVTPAPALATFNDVPTNHPFFAFVEALVAAGITSGCNASPPLYCPDNPVTRGQLAKFLGQALGLHFAP